MKSVFMFRISENSSFSHNECKSLKQNLFLLPGDVKITMPSIDVCLVEADACNMPFSELKVEIELLLRHFGLILKEMLYPFEENC